MVRPSAVPSACVLSNLLKTHMNLEDLKKKKPPELLAFAEEQGVEGAAQMRRQELMFSILQKLAANDQVITGSGTIEVIPDGFGYARSARPRTASATSPWCRSTRSTSTIPNRCAIASASIR
jgi:hypothetical protein